MEAFLVSLGDVQIGRLEMLPDQRSTRLTFYEDYRQAPRRPLLGQQFKSFHQEYRQPSRLLTFFAHLLPEGALGGILRASAKLDERQTWPLLGLLGNDLPGAVRLSPALNEDSEAATVEPRVESRQADPPTRATVPPEMWRFSLSGVQLKLSMSWFDDRLAMPAATIDGKWIVKLGDAAHPDLPEVEWSVMEWARAAGIDVPTTRLVGLDRVDGIPPEYVERAGSLCYAIERFDRGEGRLRIHIEDFAQVLDADDKYQGHSYETIGNVVAKAAGLDGLREYVRRVVFMVLSGNADAHLKNWSLIYPDGVHARLSPAYDLVSVVVYPQYNRSLALNFNRSKRFEDVSLDGFSRFARKLQVSEEAMCGWVREDVHRALQAWVDVAGAIRLSPVRRQRIDQHLKLLRAADKSIANL